jgi:hypothetical protein
MLSAGHLLKIFENKRSGNLADPVQVPLCVSLRFSDPA